MMIVGFVSVKGHASRWWFAVVSWVNQSMDSEWLSPRLENWLCAQKKIKFNVKVDTYKSWLFVLINSFLLIILRFEYGFRIVEPGRSANIGHHCQRLPQRSAVQSREAKWWIWVNLARASRHSWQRSMVKVLSQMAVTKRWTSLCLWTMMQRKRTANCDLLTNYPSQVLHFPSTKPMAIVVLDI